MGFSSVGGLVGSNQSGLVTQCSSMGIVNGSTRVGGLVGTNGSDTSATGPLVNTHLKNCYSTSTVSGVQYVGGLVGFNGGQIHESYSTGPVYDTGPTGGLATFGIGGLVGRNGGWSGWVGQSFWDTQTSTQATCNGWNVDCVGKTTTEMQTASTFLEAGWDFMGETDNGTEDIWWIDEGNDYPRLWWEVIAGN